jgi:hypothetical protein
MIANLRLMQQAYCHLKDSSFSDTYFATYLLSRFTSWRPTCAQQKFQLRHPSKESDDVVRILFPHSTINFYQTLHIGNLRLCTRSYAEKKIADDSNIVFLLNGIEYPGRIRAIFTIDNGEPLLLVAYLLNLIPFTCAIDTNENFVYPHIHHTSTSTWNFVPIEIQSFIEKSIFFQSPTGVSYFLRYPTLEHCS